ncbi:Clp protease N-terminal domain-containing protein [Phreatobacter stygius]|uniref:Peptidase n=1 Tax=Phreatobacter stygius TaxID=1940610 RepID=A0A4D7BE47_9HYPH|nr:Clp protease N-terminal domain-containing protein [Phreatobacter stygius]QCI68238.1 peptidase [Phreatobacter stygius]
MLAAIKSRLEAAKTLRQVLEAAERYALEDQQREPAAEHFLLAAIDLPDGTARHVFADVGADAGHFREAVVAQQVAALRSAGLTGTAAAPEPLRRRDGLYRASASGIEVMKTLAAHRSRHQPLRGAHVVAAVASLDHGVAAWALRSMGIDLAALREAASRY